MTLVATTVQINFPLIIISVSAVMAEILTHQTHHKHTNSLSPSHLDTLSVHKEAQP